ncbi:MAG: hypothetical protein KKH12_05940 [Gammaproteobacteria bacterium]|nr:hypothetical protein [Gammaproteobacteria bacterium]
MTQEEKTATKPVYTHTRNECSNPIATVTVSGPEWHRNDVLGVFNYWNWPDFQHSGVTKFTKNGVDTPNNATQGHPQVNPASLPSVTKEGTPLSKDNLTKLQNLIDFAEKQVLLDYKGCKGQKNSKGKKISTSEAIVKKYSDTLIGQPNFEYKVGKTEHDGNKGATKFLGMCLAYVKVALFQKGYINGVPGTGYAKNTGGDWKYYQFDDVSKKLPQVEVTYEQAYKDEDVPKVETVLKKEARVKQLNKDLAALNAELIKEEKAKDTAKAEATRKQIAAKNSELEAAKKDVEKANKDKPEKQSVKHTQPDLIYTLPGDVIVYAKVDPVQLESAGHIDIRTYHGFLSDAAWAITPALGSPPSKYSRYKVIGVYRKISDTMAMVRVQAFLRLIREHVAGETSLKDQARSYQLKQYDKDAKDPFADLNTEMKTHPYENSTKKTPAGAYQIDQKAFNDVHVMTGWPKTFSTVMQDRVAIYLLQACPTKFAPHPRRSALGYIMENKLDEAVNLIKQEVGLAHWSGDFAKFESYVNEAAKKASEDPKK